MNIFVAIALLAPFGLAPVQPDSQATSTDHRRRGSHISMPDPVTSHRDINYAESGNASQTLDLFVPGTPSSPGPLPVIVNIHGGGFSAGDKKNGVDELMPLVTRGDYAAISINYRLSGEAIWPAQIHDCKAAIRWVRANAKKYNLDPDRIGVIGASAGGHLVAMLGLTGQDKSLEGNVGKHGDVSSAVKCVVDEFGPTDFLTMNAGKSSMDHDAADSPESRLIGGAIQENKDKANAASPLTHVNKVDVPFLIIHGDADPLVPHDQSVRFAAALKGAGVETALITVHGAGHGNFRNPEIAATIRRFFDKHLRGRGEEKMVDGVVENMGK